MQESVVTSEKVSTEESSEIGEVEQEAEDDAVLTTTLRMTPISGPNTKQINGELSSLSHTKERADHTHARHILSLHGQINLSPGLEIFSKFSGYTARVRDIIPSKT